MGRASKLKPSVSFPHQLFIAAQLRSSGNAVVNKNDPTSALKALAI